MIDNLSCLQSFEMQGNYLNLELENLNHSSVSMLQNVVKYIDFLSFRCLRNSAAIACYMKTTCCVK